VIETVARAAEQEATSGIGKAVKTATGEVNVAKSGHLFSCASPCLILRDKYAEIFAKDEGLMAELRRLEGEAEKVAEARKAAANADDPLWRDYVAYFEDRLSCIKAGKKGIKPPLSWEGYSEFLGKFRRGTAYQESVLKGMRAAEGAPEAKPGMFADMAEPVVES